ncbi:MAG: Nif3-like dinuclear metal center hexameric protein [Oscillospiraceae bacterium]|nr:Nif3-like dinuclear metal center hexameric protein [Oscillospiraceae bacterium]
MVTVRDIYECLEAFAPLEMKMDFDNPGFLVGRGGAPVERVLVSLDITENVIAEAADMGAQLIVSHHPLFFSLKSVTDGDGIGRKVLALASSGIAAICMHTNLDAANGGVNDALAGALGLNDTELLNVEGVNGKGEEFSYGRVGFLPEPTDMRSFLERVKNVLGSNGLRYHDAGRPVHKVASVGGSGGSMLELAAAKDCDTFVTSDIKYDVFLTAKELGMNLIDGDHFCTENTVVPVIADLIGKAFPDTDVHVSARHRQTARFM